MGEIGAELARRFGGFGCTVLYNKRNRLPEAAEREMSTQFAEVDDMLARSDCVCMLLPFSLRPIRAWAPTSSPA